MKDTSVIPVGLYCHGQTRSEVCPYWSIRSDLPKQENGYCSFLEKSDWDINEEIDAKGGCTIIYSRDENVVPPISAHDISGGLLWDQCKECGINVQEVI